MSELTAEQLAFLNSIFAESECFTDVFRRHACSTDASFYRLIPKAVLKPSRALQVQQTLAGLASQQLALTFRGGGTSLSGQAVSDEVLMDLKHTNFCRVEVLENGEKVRCGPGVRGGRVNQYLSAFGRTIGPDPASLEAATIGGILANNASGMCCGTRFNSYQTIDNMTFVLADGYRLDTSSPDAHHQFLSEKPELAKRLMQLRQKCLKSSLKKKIEHKYRIKNTSGYGLNSFLDFEHPLDILTHLLIGSEGTLAFIEEATLVTVPHLQHRATSLVLFEALPHTAEMAALMGEMGASAVELIDDSSLQAAMRIGSLSQRKLPPECGALLIEFAEENDSLLESKIKAATANLGKAIETPNFSIDPNVRSQLWAMRKSLFPAVGGRRPFNHALITEDFCVDPPDMPAFIGDLKRLFARFEFPDHVIFGHAKDGNLHFVMHAPLHQPDGLHRYGNMMDEICEVVTQKYNGSLKAEHGTGRNVAPFLVQEWGSELYDVMLEIKQALDPHNVLNPGVLINSDSQIHLKNIKDYPAVDPVVDDCMDCGFCERVCPSRNLTLTPRQRIAAMRSGFDHQSKDFQYQALNTCAVDGMCGMACPLDIDTGQLVKKQRNQMNSRLAKWFAKRLVRHFGSASRFINFSIGFAAYWKPKGSVRKSLNWFTGLDPRRCLPQAAQKVSLVEDDGPVDVYVFPSCLHRLANFSEQGIHPLQAQIALLKQAGFEAKLVPYAKNLCCGTPFFSKGFNDAGHHMQAQLLQTFQQIPKGIPIVCDVGPCAFELKQFLNEKGWLVQDLLEFIDAYHERFQFEPQGAVMIHPTCSQVKSGLQPVFSRVMAKAAEQVHVPKGWSCCGQAGDRGYYFPELCESALQEEKLDCQKFFDDGARHALSSCPTCEGALTEFTDIKFHSYVYFLLERLKKESP